MKMVKKYQDFLVKRVLFQFRFSNRKLAFHIGKIHFLVVGMSLPSCILVFMYFAYQQLLIGWLEHALPHGLDFTMFSIHVGLVK